MRIRSGIVVAPLFFVASIACGQGMPGMTAVENSVGFSSSGTSVEPITTSESAPMVHQSLGSWTLMVHANAFLVDTQQSGPRGKDKLFSVNWVMPMLSRDFGRNSLSLRTMWSFEPATVTNRRYPELFQTGEIAYGLPIVDGQHPHDLFMEIAGRYDYRISERARLFVYGGPVGDPALGPPAFPHRASASENPVAVLGHHQQDSTHVSNSVFTVGFLAGWIQLEASTFHGREPDENRWDIDGGNPDSFSSRLSMGDGGRWSGQFSIGRLHSREALESTGDTRRISASVHHNARFESGHIASSLIWGRNKDVDGADARVFNAYTAESTVNFLNRNWAWIRVENVDRDRSLLVGERLEALNVEEEPLGRVQAYTFGYERDFRPGSSFLNIGIGIQATAYGLPESLKTPYGGRPAGFSVFVHLRPRGNMQEHMQLMHQH